MRNDYYEKRDEDCRKTVEEILNELPSFAADYFIGIENVTSPLTRKNYAYDLRIFFRFLCEKLFRNKKPREITLLDLESLRTDDLERFSGYLSSYEINGKREYCKEHAKARKIASVRSFYKYLFNRDRINTNVAAKLSMPKLHEKEIIRLEDFELSSLLSVVESGDGLTPRQKAAHAHTKVRDTAIITLFLGTGIRISELVGLNVDDIDFSVNGFRITRKGGNRVILYFSDQVKAPLLEWISARETRPDLPKTENALFVSEQDRRITVRAVENLVKKYSQIVTPLKKITPHKLRSTFGTNLYRQTGDIYVVADVLGHSDVNTTKRHYAAISDDIRKAAANSVFLGKQQKDEEITPSELPYLSDEDAQS